jgi:hypothetical protein
MLERRYTDPGLEVRRQIVGGALHTEVMARSDGRLAVLEATRKAER